MSGFIKCTLELNFGEDSIFNTTSTITVDNDSMDIYDIAASILYPALIGIGYQHKTIKEVLKIES